MIYNEQAIMKEHWLKTIEEYNVPQTIILAKHLGVDLDDAQGWIDSEDYLVYTDEEADDAVRDYIEETVWAFTPSFLRHHTGVSEEAIQAIQSMCEDGNDAILSMIKDFDAFVDDAISSDGRGHFLAPYDHEENEITFNGVDYYIYRRN